MFIFKTGFQDVFGSRLPQIQNKKDCMYFEMMWFKTSWKGIMSTLPNYEPLFDDFTFTLKT